MPSQAFRQELRKHYTWKFRLIKCIQRYHHWLARDTTTASEHKERIQHALNTLRSDRVTVAFMGEFSRGKTELINAIFFANTGHRLLPSCPGRTTMCPTEIFFDQVRQDAYIRMLPIETRASDVQIHEWKKRPEEWQEIALTPGEPQQLQEVFKQMMQTKKVSSEEAGRLGLYFEAIASQEKEEAMPALVQIPRWRHIMVSYPHPILQQGLTVLDTPGLNALGNEPELTYGMLPNAQAVIFVLSADTGVTRSDHEVWQQHLQAYHKGNKHKALAVVLNKIDTLWDELQADPYALEAIELQRQQTATSLHVDPARIFPLSAQKGLIGRIKKDQALQEKSRISELEAFLSDEILANRQHLLLSKVDQDLGNMLRDSQHREMTRLRYTENQLTELLSLKNKNKRDIEIAAQQIRSQQQNYLTTVADFQHKQQAFRAQYRKLLGALSIGTLDKQITEARYGMRGSWTTRGLKTVMKQLFDQLYARMRTITMEAENSRRLVEQIYADFQAKNSDSKLHLPKAIAVMKYRVELELLCDEAENFRSSTLMLMTEQRFVIKQFILSIVSRAREIFYEANRECSIWCRDALNPILTMIQEEHKNTEQRLQTLTDLRSPKENPEKKIKELQVKVKTIHKQIENLTKIKKMMLMPIPA